MGFWILRRFDSCISVFRDLRFLDFAITILYNRYLSFFDARFRRSLAIRFRCAYIPRFSGFRDSDIRAPVGCDIQRFRDFAITRLRDIEIRIFGDYESAMCLGFDIYRFRDFWISGLWDFVAICVVILGFLDFDIARCRYFWADVRRFPDISAFRYFGISRARFCDFCP